MAKKDTDKKSAKNALEKLFLHALKDIYSAEGAAHKALKELAESASLPSLQAALTAHRDETAEQIERLKEVFNLLGVKPRGVSCRAMNGILEEGEEILDAFGGTEAADAAVILVAQAMEHYEINRYGTLREWARELGHEDAARILSNLLDEDYAADQMLTKIAADRANALAEGAQAGRRGM